MSVKEIFETETPKEINEIAITPELIEKIKNAFIALEELLEEAFPNNKLINKLLNFFASYVKWLF